MIRQTEKVYLQKKEKLLKKLTSGITSVRVAKKTASNLFRYLPSPKEKKPKIKLAHFDNIIHIDLENKILDLEGLTPYEKIVDFTLKHGLLPTVAPELKHITVGGAIVGIGIESTGFQYGFVHDGLLEAEVLLPDGRIVLANPDNEYADLFYALPNSYGTLGYILRAKIKLYAAGPYVKLNIYSFSEPTSLLKKMSDAVSTITHPFIDGLVFSDKELYLILGSFVKEAPVTADIYHSIFYKLIQQQSEIILSTYDYIFRYDPDWFWNIPETSFYYFFRRWAPKKIRNSGFYKKYTDFKNRFLNLFNYNESIDKKYEKLIQDWEVPFTKAEEFLNFALKNINLNGKPWAIVPITPQHAATLYPLTPQTTYFNLGCYCSAVRKEHQPAFYTTQLMDKKCFMMNGLKMLYSSTLLSKQEFNELYNGKMYQKLKQKYDPNNLSGNLFDKVVSKIV